MESIYTTDYYEALGPIEKSTSLLREPSQIETPLICPTISSIPSFGIKFKPLNNQEMLKFIGLYLSLASEAKF